MVLNRRFAVLFISLFFEKFIFYSNRDDVVSKGKDEYKKKRTNYSNYFFCTVPGCIINKILNGAYTFSDEENYKDEKY